MKIEVRLFATLREHLPQDSDRTKTVLELPEGTRIRDVIERLAIPPQLAQLVMVDGVHERDGDRVLLDGESLSIFPPVAGGEAGMEGWKDGRMEEWKNGRLEGWKNGRMEGSARVTGAERLAARDISNLPSFQPSILPSFHSSILHSPNLCSVASQGASCYLAGCGDHRGDKPC